MGKFDNIFKGGTATAARPQAPAVGTGKFSNIFSESSGYKPRPTTTQSKPLASVPTAVNLFPGTTQALADLQIDPLSLKADPKKALGDAWNTIKGAVVQEGKNISDFIGSLDSSKSASERVGTGLKAVAGAGTALFSPISALFAGANQIPILGSVTKLISLPFTAAGDTAPHLSNKIIDELPISQEAKDKIKPGLGEVFSLASQIALGKVVDIAGKNTLPSERAAATFKDTFIKENPTLTEDVNKIGPNKINKLVENHGMEDAKTIVKQAIDLANEKKSATVPAQTPEPAGKFENIFSQPLQAADKPVVPSVEGTGITKSRGLSSGVEAKAIESKLTTGFGDLPEYQTVNIKDQAQKAADLISKDYEQAKRIAMGSEAAPKDVLPESVFVAVEDRAIKEGDIATLHDLATRSALTGEATTMGQRIRTLAERDPDSPVSAIKEIQKSREEAVKGKNKDMNQALEKVKTNIKAEIQKTAPTPKTWDDFIQTLQC